MRKRVGALVAGVVSVALLGGCVVFDSAVVGEQQDVVGKLRLTFTLCASGQDDGVNPGEDHPGCPSPGNGTALQYGMEGAQYQVLFAIRVPAGTGVPETISATPGPAPPAGGTITARRSASYEAELSATKPAAAGSRWVGYLSDTYLFDDGADDVPAQSAQVVVDLELPRNADGSPFVGPLALRPVVGARVVNPASGQPADRPVECGDDPTAIDASSYTICIDAPVPAQVDTDLSFQTRDFGVLAGNATASPGQKVSLPFNVRGAGALPAGLTAALSATTALPGVGAVTPSVASAALTNGSDTRVTVPVTIPRKAGPGVFDVTLSGRLENGQTRTGVARLTVRDRQRPVVSRAKARPKRFKPATKRKPKRGTNVTFALSEAAKLRLTVERCAKRAGKRKRGRCVRWTALKGGLTRPGVAGANTIRFNGRLRGRALKAGGYRLVLKPTDAAGNVGEVARVAIAVRG